MSGILKDDEKVFCATEFRDAWLLLLSKRHNPAKSLELFTVTSPDGVERFNVGINCMATGRVIFPARSHDTVSHAFQAIAFALENVCGDCGEQLGD